MPRENEVSFYSESLTHLCAELVLQHMLLVVLGVCSALQLPLLAQGFLGHLALMLPALCQVLQQLCFLALESDRGIAITVAL